MEIIAARRAQQPGAAHRLLGPHVMRGGQNLQGAGEFVGPGADIKGATDASGATMNALLSGNYGQAAIGMGETVGNLAFLALPGTLQGAKKGLEGLAAEAKKAGSFAEFAKNFVTKIRHGQYWHVTDDPNFKVDPKRSPTDMSSLATGGDAQGLMVTSDLPLWAEHYGDGRKYAARIEAGDTSNLDQVNRGFGNEFFVGDPDKLSVKEVMPIDRAMAQDETYRNALPQSREELRKFYDEANALPTDEASRMARKPSNALLDTNAGVDAISDAWKARGVRSTIHESDDSIKLADILVPRADRSGGVGTEFMDELVAYADKQGKRLDLTPATKNSESGTTSRSRLVNFYKRFGFVENKGRNKDFRLQSGGMYRQPQQPKALPTDEASRMARKR
jgi:GNAT superfamily N-acetyltransferase